jgi:hypothetical protein
MRVIQLYANKSVGHLFEKLNVSVEAKIRDVIYRPYFVSSDKQLSPVGIHVNKVRVDVLQQVHQSFCVELNCQFVSRLSNVFNIRLRYKIRIWWTKYRQSSISVAIGYSWYWKWRKSKTNGKWRQCKKVRYASLIPWYTLFLVTYIYWNSGGNL